VHGETDSERSSRSDWISASEDGARVHLPRRHDRQQHRRAQDDHAQAAVGLVEQFRGDREVDSGRGRIDMSHERRELLQPAGGIEPLPIPAQQTADREAVAETVQRWW
jgi:hypothetical protein